jgi:hypothetical protein
MIDDVTAELAPLVGTRGDRAAAGQPLPPAPPVADAAPAGDRAPPAVARTVAGGAGHGAGAAQAVHPARVKPELIATASNNVWSWDVTRLHGPAKWSYLYLYLTTAAVPNVDIEHQSM